MRPAVFLDRDGVLNRIYLHQDGKTHPPSRPGELEILPGVAQACGELRQAGFLLIVVTNQPDVARGTQTREVVEAINNQLWRQLSLDDVCVCYHDTPDGCACRKPKPGLLQSAADVWGINLAQSYIVGDRLTDIEAGRAAGCKTVLIGDGASVKGRSRPDFKAASLAEAAGLILKGITKRAGKPRQNVLTQTF